MDHGGYRRNTQRTTIVDKVKTATNSLKTELTVLLLSELEENCQNHFLSIPFTNFGALDVWTLLFYGADPTEDVLFDPSIPSYFTSTALHYAMGFNCTTTIDLLIKYGADVNCLDTIGLTPLMVGVEHRNLQLIEHLVLSHGANPNHPGPGGMTVLHFAVKSSDNNPQSYLPVVQLLLELGADPNLQTLKGHTPLGICCSRQDLATARLLLENGAEVEGRNTNLFTPLHLAVVFEAQEIVKMLLTEYKADVHAVAADGVLPMHCAIYSNSVALAKLLIENGALLGISYPTFYVHDVCQRCCFVDMLQLFMDSLVVSELKYVNAHERTPLHYAVMNPQTRSQAVEFLLNYGSDINVSDTAQLTPLQLALHMRPNDPIVGVLVEHVRKLRYLGLEVSEGNLISFKHYRHPGEMYYDRLHQNEIQSMCRRRMHDGFALTYYQLFTLPVRRLIRFLRLDGVIKGLLSQDLNGMFPLYGHIIRNHVQQLAERAEIHNDFAGFCRWVFKDTALPRGFVERLMGYFSDEEMLDILYR